MNICYVREAYLDQLRSNIRGNLPLYEREEPWLSDFFGHDSWFLQSPITCGDIKLIEPKDARVHYDLENTKILYSALKHLKIPQAVDERLWAYLTHVTFWKYMRRRWPVEKIEKKDNPANFVRDRYFFLQGNRDRALVRNGIARLWWYGYVSYDEERSDPFELTGVLLRKLDIALQLLERRFSRNRIITTAILSVLHQREIDGKPFPSREKFRDLMRHINRLGGVTILDALDKDDIQRIVASRLDS